MMLYIICYNCCAQVGGCGSTRSTSAYIVSQATPHNPNPLSLGLWGVAYETNAYTGEREREERGREKEIDRES